EAVVEPARARSGAAERPGEIRRGVPRLKADRWKPFSPDFLPAQVGCYTSLTGHSKHTGHLRCETAKGIHVERPVDMQRVGDPEVERAFPAKQLVEIGPSRREGDFLTQESGKVGVEVHLRTPHL